MAANVSGGLSDAVRSYCVGRRVSRRHLATRLSEDPQRSVLLIEAGPDYPTLEQLPDEVKHGYATATDIMVSDHNWQFVGKATDKAPEMMVPRGKVTGGSSAINGQVFLRGVPEDYDAWAAMGNDEWHFEHCFEYFRKIETDTDFGDSDFHSANGPIIVRRFKRDEWLPDQQAFYNACRAAGFPDSPDHNHPDATGIGPVPCNNPNGIRWSTALGYLSQARHRLNLTIRPNCMVHRIIFDGTKAVGVEVESGGQRFTVAGKEIILSSGAVGFPASPVALRRRAARPAAPFQYPCGPPPPWRGTELTGSPDHLHHLAHEEGTPSRSACSQNSNGAALDCRGLASAQ